MVSLYAGTKLANMASSKGNLLASCDFPMYLVKSLGERHFLVAGGGGKAKTGISNAIEIYEVKKKEKEILCSSVCRHDLGEQAAMNGATFYDGRNHKFAAGLNDECHLFSLKYKVVTPAKSTSDEKDEETVKQRKTNRKETPESSRPKPRFSTKHVTFEVDKIKSVKSDFCKGGSFQKVVRFSPDHSILATGGADGHLRVWNATDLTKLHDIAAHKEEIDDIDFSPKGDKIVTISRGSCFSVWNTQDGKKHLDMEWPGKAGEHRFRSCRFGLIEGQLSKGYNLYTINIPIKRQTKPDPCFIAKWEGSTFKPKLVVNAGVEPLCSMAVSSDGVYIGVGMLTGSVAVYISFSLQRLYYVKEVHSIFVTGLDFMPMSESTKAVTGKQDFTLLSISADNTIRLHQEPNRNTFSLKASADNNFKIDTTGYNIFYVLLGAMVVLLLTFWIMSELGL